MRGSPGRYAAGLFVLFVFLAAAAPAQNFWVVFPNPGETPHDQLTRRLNLIGQEYLRRRAREIASVQTRDAAEWRQKAVREKILRLLGGLPDRRGPLNTRHVGTVDRGDYRFEKIIFESLPGFYVTANVYVPGQGSGPFPAILMPVGHSAEGKEGERTTAISLARKGFVVLKYDPIGQGERLQYYDPDLRASRVGGPTQEHSHANGHSMLIGENVARYRIWDGMRGIDYLLTREDVDPQRIGCTGCSGGGTLTAYISALDERVKASAPGCYITSWEELLEKPGPQDGEQSFAGFLSEGLNIADYVELFAPKPLLIASTTEDFFSIEGSRQAYEEAKRFYSLFGADERIERFVGPGPHGVPLESRQAIYQFFIRHLNQGQGDPREAPVQLDPPETILCTKTGQVADSLGGETVFTLTKQRAAGLIPRKSPILSASDAGRLRLRLAQDIRSLAAVDLQPGGPPPRLKIHRTMRRDGVNADLVSFEVDTGVNLTGVLLTPSTPGIKPAVIAIDSRHKGALAAAGGDMESLARAGYIVLALQPRGVPEVPPAAGPPDLIGDFYLAFRAVVSSRTLTGMRAEDVIRGVDYLVSRPDVDRGKILGLGIGQAGVYLLHAAVLDERIGRIATERTLALYRLAVDRPIHRHLYEVAIPGVLKKYDLDDLLAALAPRRVTIVNPVDALGRPLRLSEFRSLCTYAFESDRNLGQVGRLEVVYRGERDPLAQLLVGRP